jgi:phenylacetic acid degradation operon negative regulatory protein
VQDRHLPTIAPLTARSVAISALLGYHPPALPVSELVKVGALFGIAERTTRVALTRMAADGDVLAESGVYRLTERLVRRQALQEDGTSPRTKAWDGSWEMGIVTATTGRGLPDRVALRKSMFELRLAELREGVWLRPDNLLDPDGTPRRPPALVTDQCTYFTCRHPDPERLVDALWDLPSWASEAARLLAEFDDTESLADGFMLVAAVFRHLLLDPVLPQALLPADWPGDELRQRHASFRTTFAVRLREYTQQGGTP